MPNFREEVPEIEEFVDWLCDHPDTGERMALRIQREALYNAYLKGMAARPEAQQTDGWTYTESEGYELRSCKNCDRVQAKGPGGWSDVP